MNTLIPGSPLRSLSPTSNEYQRAQGVSRAAKPARVARFTLDAPEHSGTISGAIGDILPPGVALTSNLAVIFTLNQYRSCPPKSAPRSGKDGHSLSSAFIRPIPSSATAEAPIASSPSSPNQSHTAREQASVTVHYRWHPRCGQRLSVRWVQQHGGVTHYHCISQEGAPVPVPAWMTDAVHCAGLSLASSPQASTEALAELGKLLRVVLSRWHQEEVPCDETTGTGVSVRKRPPALERARELHAGNTASVDATAIAGSSSARRGDEERKRGER